MIRCGQSLKRIRQKLWKRLHLDLLNDRHQRHRLEHVKAFLVLIRSDLNDAPAVAVVVVGEVEADVGGDIVEVEVDASSSDRGVEAQIAVEEDTETRMI